VAVKDTGIGIKKQDLGNIFARYRRIDEEKNKNIEGSGLGLAIVQSLLKLMEGTIEVESTYGEGSTFTVVIPQEIYGNSTISSYKAATTQKMEKSIEDLYIAPEARVLVVDDNNVNLVVAKGFLKRTQAKVTTCDSGKECLELMKQTKYDIIFLDHMMPDLDGIGTLKRSQILHGNLNRFTPIIALTANAMSGMREEYLKLGFTDYISKPIESDRLYDLFYNTISKEKIVKIEPGE
jgi:CheY-like chemotaxis protein